MGVINPALCCGNQPFEEGLESMATKRSHYYSFLVRLSEDVHNKKRISNRNPEAIVGKPWAYAAFNSERPPSSKDQLRMMFRSGTVARKYAEKVVSGSIKRHVLIEGAMARCEHLVEDHRAEGWTIANNDPQKKHWVYVVELIEPAKEDGVRRKTAYYVGQTGLTPEERYAQHKAGIHANREVQLYGAHLRQDLIDNAGPMTHLDSLRLERQLADQLELRGLKVYGGH